MSIGQIANYTAIFLYKGKLVNIYYFKIEDPSCWLIMVLS